MGLRIFVSYARDDLFHIRQLVEILRDGGHDPWFDHRILPGQDWKVELSSAIRLCEVFLYAITPRSVKSEWCQWEFQEAMKYGKGIVPVVFESATSLPPPLDRYQHANFTQGVDLNSALKLVAGIWEMAVQMHAEVHFTDQPQGMPSRVIPERPVISRVTCMDGQIAEIRLIKGHTEPVQSVAFDPETNLLASASWDDTVRLWDVLSGSFIAENRSHFNDVLSIAFSPTSDVLASGSRDRTISLWNLMRRFERSTILRGHNGAVTCLDFTEDGENIISGASSTPTPDASVRMWDVPQRSSTLLYSHDQTVTSLAFSPSDRYLASGSDDCTIRLSEQTTRRPKFTLLTGHIRPVKAVAFSPDGMLLASGGSDHTVRIWRIPKGDELVTLRGHTDTVTSVAFSPDGTLLASASRDHKIYLWELPTGKPLVILRGHTDSINAITFSLDGTYLASASRDHTVRLWGVVPRKTRPTGEIKRLPGTKPLN